MVRGRGLRLPSVLRFTILYLLARTNLALLLECRFELLEANAH